MKLRPYQQQAVDLALNAAQGDRLMIASPTGTGKGVMQQAVQKETGCTILSPSLEVLRGYAKRAGISAHHDALFAANLTTPVRFRNRLIDGVIEPPEMIIVDEAHHSTLNSTVTEDIMAICPMSTFIGFTATPFRGSARGTQQLRSLWGQPHVVLSIREAVEQCYMTFPSMNTVPLLNDDCLEVRNGQFVIKSIDDETGSRAESLAQLILDKRASVEGGVMVSLPSTDMVMLMQRLLGDKATHVIQDTSDAHRAVAYDRAEKGTVLLQINVVSEGVDLPWMRHLIDAKPTLSPVAWLQQFGRITRPGELAATYTCTNRNLERHAYLCEGLVPSSKVVEAQEAFDGPSERLGGRFIGLESVGRLMAIPVPMANGMVAAMYNVNESDQDKQTEWLILCLPNIPDPICWNRVNSGIQWNEGMPERKWGKWVKQPMPMDLTGYRSSNARNSLTDKQRAWWKKSAARKGLDAEAHEKLTGRQFAILPALYDSRLTLRGLL